MTLKIYGFGSERFDAPIILPGLLSIWNLKPSEIQVVKRQSGYMKMGFSIHDNQIEFYDARNLIGFGSLDKFAKTFGAEESKGIFCYEYFQSIDQAINTADWPNYSHFKSSLVSLFK